MQRGTLFCTVGLLAIVGLASYYSDRLRDIATPVSASERQLADARKKLAFVSLQVRLPTGKPISPTKPLSADAQKHWEELETYHARSDRAEMLKALHERTRNVFVDRPGEGMGRMVETPADILFAGEDDKNSIEQAGEPAYFPLSAGDVVARVTADADFRDIHRSGMMNFFPSRGFGYVKDRDQVAGFKPHGFRHTYWMDHVPLRVDHVLLIGILKHEQPVVYLTEKLPSMDKIHLEKTRPLDLFEQAGLASLRDGEDLHIASKDAAFRMIGALRATKTCQKCHDAETGDLLGAFSYTLRPVPKNRNDAVSEK